MDECCRFGGGRLANNVGAHLLIGALNRRAIPEVGNVTADLLFNCQRYIVSVIVYFRYMIHIDVRRDATRPRPLQLPLQRSPHTHNALLPLSPPF